MIEPGVLKRASGVAVDPATGNVVVADTGKETYVYDPSPSASIQALGEGESLVDTFTYTVGDGSSSTDAATVTITALG